MIAVAWTCYFDWCPYIWAAEVCSSQGGWLVPILLKWLVSELQKYTGVEGMLQQWHRRWAEMAWAVGRVLGYRIERMWQSHLRVYRSPVLTSMACSWVVKDHMSWTMRKSTGVSEELWWLGPGEGTWRVDSWEVCSSAGRWFTHQLCMTCVPSSRVVGVCWSRGQGPADGQAKN